MVLRVPLVLTECAHCHHHGALLCERCLASFVWCAPAARPAALMEWIASAVEYDEVTASFIRAAKYEGCFQYTVPMADCMALALQRHLWRRGVTCLVPVPLHPYRQAWRGYNQAHCIAEHLGERLHIPVYPHALLRTKFRATQAQSTGAERKGIQESFAAGRRLPSGHTICLIDDVVTTGSTLAACAQALQVQAPRKIVAATFARTE